MGAVKVKKKSCFISNKKLVSEKNCFNKIVDQYSKPANKCRCMKACLVDFSAGLVEMQEQMLYFGPA